MQGEMKFCINKKKKALYMYTGYGILGNINLNGRETDA